MSWTLTNTFKLGSASTGLTLIAALVNMPARTFAAKDIAGAFVELGEGDYGFSYAGAPDGFRGIVMAYTGAFGSTTDPTQRPGGLVMRDKSGYFAAQDEVNAKAGTLGGLPTVDANNNVHGLQVRSVSDGSTIGTSTPTTAQTISETTSSGNTLKVDARRLPRNADEGRLVYSQNTWTALTDFTITGTTPTITAAGAIRLNPSTVGNFDGQALELNGVVSASNNYDIDLTFTVVALGATAYGVAIGRRSVNTWYPLSVAAHVNPSAAPNQLLVWPQATGAPAGFVGSENIVQVMAVGDQVRIRGSQRGPLFSVAIENITQKIVDRYAVLNSLAPGTSFHTPNTSTFRIFGLGGTFDVTSIQIVDRSPQFPLIACVGNSKTSGFSAGSIQATWAYLLNSFGPCVNFGGEGDRTVEVMQRLADITSAPPRYVVLNIGRNDLAASVPTATWQANYQTIVTALKNVGCTVIHLLPIPETIESNQSALTTYINSTYPSDLKIDVTSQWVNATDLATDGVHPNAAGHLLIYKAIVASGYIAPDNRMATQVGNLPTDYQQRGVVVTLPALPNVTVGGYAAGEDPATLLLSNPTYKLTTDANGRIGVNNFPVEFLSSAEQTELTTTINDLNTLLGRSDTAGTVSTISTNIATLLTRISGSLTIANGKVAATMAAGDGVDAAASLAGVQSLTTTIGTAGSGLTATAGLVWADAASYAAGTKGAITAALYTLLQTVNLETVQTLSDAAATLANGATAVQLAAINTLVQALAVTLGTAGAGLTALPYNGPSVGAIQSGLQTAALAATQFTTLSAGLSSVPGTVWTIATRTLTSAAGQTLPLDNEGRPIVSPTGLAVVRNVTENVRNVSEQN